MVSAGRNEHNKEKLGPACTYGGMPVPTRYQKAPNKTPSLAAEALESGHWNFSLSKRLGSGDMTRHLGDRILSPLSDKDSPLLPKSNDSKWGFKSGQPSNFQSHPSVTEAASEDPSCHPIHQMSPRLANLNRAHLLWIIHVHPHSHVRIALPLSSGFVCRRDKNGDKIIPRELIYFA